MKPDRNIDITAELSFFHISVGRSTPSHELLEFFEIGEDICLGTKIWLRDDLHQRRTSTIVVTESLASCMDELARVILDMHMMYTKGTIHTLDDRTYLSSHRYRLIELSDLISHREIWIKITLTIKNTHLSYLRSECMSRPDSKIDDSGRYRRQHPRESHTHRTDMDIGLWSKIDSIRTTTEHLGMRLDTDMGFETHDDLVFFAV
jgi:hypothetical protein